MGLFLSEDASGAKAETILKTKQYTNNIQRGTTSALAGFREVAILVELEFGDASSSFLEGGK